MTFTAILASNLVTNLRMEYQNHRSLYEVQPILTQQFLDLQAGRVAHAILDNDTRVRFTLPVSISQRGKDQVLVVPAESRDNVVGHKLIPWKRDLRDQILQQFVNLEQSSNQALSQCGSLMRFVVAQSMVHQMLPDGRSVHYQLLEGDEIPSQPVETNEVSGSALMAGSDAISEQPEGNHGRGELQVPYSPVAMRFFLPQWVTFDDNDQLLVRTLEEAEGHIRSMQTYLQALHHAVVIDPYIVADETYQRKRTGMLGQLVNQGRALSRYETNTLVQAIQRRARQNSLNRGLTLELPYFDDQDLAVKNYPLEVIPVGRIMFIPAFIVLAVRKEYGKISQDTRLNSSTRKHLLSLLAILEKAFLNQKEFESI
jgi:hypothetical protein